MPNPQVDHAELIGFTRELVRIRSVNDPERGTTESAAARLVEARMRAWGWAPEVTEVAPDRLNVVAVLSRGTPGPTLMLEGHTDVVTEGDIDEWTHHPYGAEIVDGRLYGRGSADMKGGLAAMMFAARAIETSGEFPGTIVVAALCDEEEMMIGAKHFAASPLASVVDGAIVCEPEAGEVCITQKGGLRLRVDCSGKMSHGAMPHEGRNPLTALALFQVAIADYQAELQSEFGDHEHLGLPWVTPTTIRAGTIAQMNVIPRDAVLTLDVRSVPGMTHDRVRADLRRIAGGITDSSGVHFSFSTLDDRPPTSVPADDPIVRAVVEGHLEVTGNLPPFGGVPGTTDGTILWRDAGIPVVVYGPGGKWIAHQADEYVEIADLTRCADVYVAAARRFLGSDQ